MSCSIKEKNITVLKILWFTYFFSPFFLSPKAQCSSWYFIISIVLPFTKCHVVQSYRNVKFSDWLLLLCNIHLRFIHVLSWFNMIANFLLLLKYSLFCMREYLYPSVFIHSLIEGHLRYFQFGGIMNKAAINTCVQVFVWTLFSAHLG